MARSRSRSRSRSGRSSRRSRRSSGSRRSSRSSRSYASYPQTGAIDDQLGHAGTYPAAPGFPVYPFRNPFLPYLTPTYPGAVGDTRVDPEKGVMYGDGAYFRHRKNARAAQILSDYAGVHGIPPSVVQHDLATNSNRIAPNEAVYATDPIGYDWPDVDDGTDPNPSWASGITTGATQYGYPYAAPYPYPYPLY